MLHSNMIGLTELQNTSPEMRLDMIKLAVLKIMQMNNALYIHLHSSTFDVPDYEKENIVYNNETLSIEFDEYFCHGFYNQDFKFHQKLLEVQIKCNRRIRQNVRECREMYADRHNPLYSRKKYKTREIFPDAVEQNLPELLPMTHLCDHLLTAFHYMHDPQIALVMDFIVSGGNHPSATPVTLPNRSSDVFPGGFHQELSCMIPKETRVMTASVEISSYLRPVQTTAPVLPVDMTRQLRAVEFPGCALPVEIPQSISFFQKSRHEIPMPPNLQDTSKHQNADISKPEMPKSANQVDAHTAAKPAEKPKIICESDIVGQILMQGLNTSKTKFPRLLHGSSGPSIARSDNKVTKSAKAAKISKQPGIPTKPVKDGKAAQLDKPRTTYLKTTIKSKVTTTNVTCDKKKVEPNVATKKVAWDVNKVLAPKSTVPEKQSRDLLSTNVKDEMDAKRQRMSQWLHNHATQPAKTVSSGTKRKSSLMDKSSKDHSVKRQKMGDARTEKSTEKKSSIKWIKW